VFFALGALDLYKMSGTPDKRAPSRGAGPDDEVLRVDEPETTWIEAHRAALPDGAGGVALARAAVAVAGARITRVARGDAAVDAARRAAAGAGQPWRSLATGELLAPAFVDAHTHLAMGCFRALPVDSASEGNVVEDLFFAVESNLTAADVEAFARWGAYESLLSGVGMVWDHYYFGEAVARGLSAAGLTAVVAPTLQDVAGPGAGAWEDQLATTHDLDTQAWADRGVWAAYGPHATDTVSADLWGVIRDDAGSTGLPVHAHVAQSIEEFERAHDRHGCSPVAWLERLGLLDDTVASFLMVHGIFVSEQDLARLDPARHTLGFCPYSQLIFSLPADVAAWTASGVPWLVATDCAASNDAMTVQKELRFVAGLRALGAAYSVEREAFTHQGGLPAARALAARRAREYDGRRGWADASFLLERVWGAPGRMHPGARAGEIAPGALANLAVWDTAHPSMWPGDRPLRALTMGDTSGALLNLMVAGAWRGEHGDYARSITSSDAYADAQSEATARLRELFDRAGV
jgi:5-methylthioadenosine/S-adenosylhomocysteine deaminase